MVPRFAATGKFWSKRGPCIWSSVFPEEQPQDENNEEDGQDLTDDVISDGGDFVRGHGALSGPVGQWSSKWITKI